MSAVKPRVSIVIPSWNGLPHLPECIEALFAQSFKAFEVIVVDNASSDDGVAWIRAQWPRVHVIARMDNGGFATAVNAGILHVQCEYVALLNNDTAVDRHWLHALVTALEEHPEYDFAASKMILYSIPERLNAVGDVYTLRHMTAVNRGLGEPTDRYTQMERVFGACAGAALYRRILFDQVGLFDQDFFLMHEDTDFNLRCLLAGKRCLYVPAALVRHKFSASIGTVPTQQTKSLRLRNEAIAAAKNLPIVLLLWGMVTWPYRFGRRTFPLRPSKWHCLPTLLSEAPRLLVAEARGLRMGLSKRREIKHLRTVGTLEVLHWLRRGYGPV